jgi:hypothetical protein
MDHNRFDRITLALASGLSRRTLAAVAGLGALGAAGVVDAKKKKKKKVKKNEFGCVDVGKYCKNAGQCCSGICQGKKGKKKCKAHDASTCANGQKEVFCGGGSAVTCKTASGAEGLCNTTTGKAGYCTGGPGTCVPCKKDADCISTCGTGAACVPCDGCTGSNGFACVGPEAGRCGPM